MVQKVHDNKIKFACEVCGLEVQANRNVTHNIGFWVLGTFSRPLSNVGGVGHSESGSYDFPPCNTRRRAGENLNSL